ncbi:MAG: hypothetical protein HY392_00260 [Candidatus Diapherotrites archaeon]|nr:hypothetical protein [Candidatus Diapherotrites archaeon]
MNRVKSNGLFLVSVLAVFLAIALNVSAETVQIEYEDSKVTCLGSGGEGEFVVNSQEEYQKLIDGSPDLYPNPALYCVDYEFPEIDFEEKTLLGKFLSGGGCDSKVEKSVWRDDELKEVTYRAKLTTYGLCAMNIFHPNWVTVGKIPAEYSVKFEASTEQKETREAPQSDEEAVELIKEKIIALGVSPQYFNSHFKFKSIVTEPAGGSENNLSYYYSRSYYYGTLWSYTVNEYTTEYFAALNYYPDEGLFSYRLQSNALHEINETIPEEEALGKLKECLPSYSQQETEIDIEGNLMIKALGVKGGEEYTASVNLETEECSLVKEPNVVETEPGPDDIWISPGTLANPLSVAVRGSGGAGISIGPSALSDTLVIRDTLSGFSVETRSELAVEGEALYVRTAAGSSQTRQLVSILPQEALSAISASAAVAPESLSAVTLEVKDNAPVYRASTRKRGNFIFIIPVEYDVVVEVNAQTGATAVNKPWWTVLVTG